MTAEKNLVWKIGESVQEDWQFGSRTEFVNGVNTVVAGTEFDFTGYTAKIQVRALPDGDVLAEFASDADPVTILATNFATGIVRVRGAADALDDIPPGTYLYDLRMTSVSRTLFPLQGKVVIKLPITQ